LIVDDDDGQWGGLRGVRGQRSAKTVRMVAEKRLEGALQRGKTRRRAAWQKVGSCH